MITIDINLDRTANLVAPDYLLELMNDKNKEICKLCSKTLDIIQVSQIQAEGCLGYYNETCIL